MCLPYKCMRDEAGATAVEYAIIAGFIALVIVTAVKSLGDSLIPIFNSAALGIGS